MKVLFKNIFTLKNYLLIANIFLVFILILFFNLGILPLHFGDFIFFAILTLLFALYRPGWAFLFFIGMIAIENINLAPKEVGMSLRPYQLIGAMTFLAVIIRFLFQRLNFSLPKLKWFDIFPTLIIIGSFLSSIFSTERNSSLKLSIILFSFLILYFLVRIFIQTFDDLKRILPFFLSSAFIISLYGIWQNIQFKLGANSFEVMPGRPNATFMEADWLGVFLVVCLVVVFSVLYYVRKNNLKELLITDYRLLMTFCFLFLVSCFLSLILTVSRSAWLGAFVVFVVYATLFFIDSKRTSGHWQIWETGKQKCFIISALAIAIILIFAFNLTTFKLFERAQSTGGMQKITVSCLKQNNLPISISNISELSQYNCRFINLEEINSEKDKGNFVTEIFRTDPNINIRENIYQKSWQEIKNHPVLGIGWGSIGKVLGTDERGASLNSSNIFLEVYLGSGLLGILAFIAIWLWILISAIIQFQKNESEKKILGLFLLLGTIAFLIPNLFNAGIMLGILWIFWGMAQLEIGK